MLLRLQHEGWSVTVLDNLVQGKRENLPKSVRFVEGDVRDSAAVAEAMKGCHVAFHIAANFANQRSIDGPQEDLEINGQGTLNVLQEALRAKVERLVYASSSCVYGPFSGVLVENLPKHPETPYAITKLLGEYYCEFFCKHYGLKTVSLRLSNVYGPYDFPGKYRNVIPNLMRLAKDEKPLSVMGDGSDSRDFTFVEDAVEALIRAASRKHVVGEAVNVGSGNEVKINDLAQVILKVTGSKAGVVYRERRSWDHIRRRVLSTKRCEELLGFKPSTPLNDGLRRTWAWFEKNNPAPI